MLYLWYLQLGTSSQVIEGYLSQDISIILPKLAETVETQPA